MRRQPVHPAIQTTMTVMCHLIADGYQAVNAMFSDHIVKILDNP